MSWEMMQIDPGEDRVEVIPGHENVTTKGRPEVRPDFAGGDWSAVDAESRTGTMPRNGDVLW